VIKQPLIHRLILGAFAKKEPSMAFVNNLDLIIEHQLSLMEFSDEEANTRKGKRDAKRYAVIFVPSGDDSLENNLLRAPYDTDDLVDAKKFLADYTEGNDKIKMAVYDKQDKKVV
jgi:hypothetical protein